MEENIANIRKLKIRCERCGTEVVLPFDPSEGGGGVYACPRCHANFGIDEHDDIFYRLLHLIKLARNNKSATFSVICEERA